MTGVPVTLPAGVTYNETSLEFTLDPSVAAYQHLADGATQVVIVNYGVFDGTATTPHSVSFTITGTNDAPVVSGAVTGNATEAGTSVTLNALLNASDVDDGTTLTVTSVPGVLPAGVTYNAATHAFTLDPTNAAYQSLSVGVTQVVTVAYSVSDGLTSTPASVSFTVTGTNDAPVVTAGGVISGNVADPLGTGSAVAIPVTGTFAFTDVDADFSNVEYQLSRRVWRLLSSQARTGSTAALALLNDYFSATVNVAGSNGSVDWTFNPTGADIDFLRAGQIATLTFNVVVNDGSGTGTATVTRPVTITVTGTNDLVTDGATVEAQAGTIGDPLLLGVTEVNGPGTAPVTAGGIFDFVDGDLTGNIVQVIGNGGTLATLGSMTAVAGTPTASGHRDVTYTYNNTHGALDYLAQGETATAKFIVRVLDQDSAGSSISTSRSQPPAPTTRRSSRQRP